MGWFDYKSMRITVNPDLSTVEKSIKSAI